MQNYALVAELAALQEYDVVHSHIHKHNAFPAVPLLRGSHSCAVCCVICRREEQERLKQKKQQTAEEIRQALLLQTQKKDGSRGVDALSATSLLYVLGLRFLASRLCADAWLLGGGSRVNVR